MLFCKVNTSLQRRLALSPQVSAGVCAPAGAQDFTLRAGGAPRAESGARRSGAEPAWGPKPQAEPRRGVLGGHIPLTHGLLTLWKGAWLEEDWRAQKTR